MKKIALVGCGSVAARHVENIPLIGRLVAVCDVRKDRADALAAAQQAKAFYSIDDLLASEKSLDLLVVCTPNGLHAEHCIKALQAGCHVLTEKPLCLTGAAAWQIIETEKYCRRKLYLVQSARYNPLVQNLQTLLAENRLGRIYGFHLNCLWHRPESYFTGWKGKLFPDGGLLYNQFSHYLDVLLLLFGPVAEARGFAVNAAHAGSVEFEDEGAVSLRMQNGSVGSFHWSVNAFQKNHEIGLAVTAEKATVRIGGEALNEVQYFQSEEPLSLQSFQKSDVNYHREMYRQLQAETGKSALSFPNAFDGMRTVETIEKIYKAVR